MTIKKLFYHTCATFIRQLQLAWYNELGIYNVSKCTIFLLFQVGYTESS